MQRAGRFQNGVHQNIVRIIVVIQTGQQINNRVRIVNQAARLNFARKYSGGGGFLFFGREQVGQGADDIFRQGQILCQNIGQ